MPKRKFHSWPLAAAVTALGAFAAGAADLPTVASINLCTDQLVLHVADPAQIVTVSWLSADREESTLADAAASHPLNYGSAEELMRFAPDVVIAGAYTNAFTRALLRRQGSTVVDIDPAGSLSDIEANLRRVGAAIGRSERAEALIDSMRERAAGFAASRTRRPIDTVVVRPGGFTVEAPSLAHELLTLAGLRNLPAERGLDRWGSLSVETLLHEPPELLVFTTYHGGSASLANAVLAHPALENLSGRVPRIDVPAALFSCGLPSSLDVVEQLSRAADRVHAAVTVTSAKAER